MEILEKMDYVHQFAEKNARFESKIKHLRAEIQPLRTAKNTQEITELSLPLRERIFLIIVSDLVIGTVLNKTLSSLLTLAVNGGMTRSQARAAGHVSYSLVPVIWPVGIILAIPLALIVTFLISKILNRKKLRENNQKQRENEQIAAENTAITEENQKIRERNQQIEKEINDIKQEQNQLFQNLTQLVPEYPVDYLLPEITDFVTDQIKSGKANSINQAIVQYVAVYEK